MFLEILVLFYNEFLFHSWTKIILIPKLDQQTQFLWIDVRNIQPSQETTLFLYKKQAIRRKTIEWDENNPFIPRNIKHWAYSVNALLLKCGVVVQL